MRCGLVGRKLAHSYSKRIHKMLSDYSYDLFEVEPDALEEFVRRGGMDGLNVTIPYKKTVLQWCAGLSPAALKIGSVNTLVYGKDGSIRGHNTDYDGFLYLADSAGVGFAGKKVLILGSGGTSLTSVRPSRPGSRRVVVVSRSGENNYGNLDRHRDAQVMSTPRRSACIRIAPGSVEPDRFPRLSGVLDVVYNPLRTGLVGRRKDGNPASGGLPIWCGRRPRRRDLCRRAPSGGKTEKVLRNLSARSRISFLSGCRAAGNRAWAGNQPSIGARVCGYRRAGGEKSRRRSRILSRRTEKKRSGPGREAVREAGAVADR